MELEGDSPVPRPPAAPEPPPTQNIRVTPENVVALAVMFRRCADRLGPQIRAMTRDLRLEEPWMDDPVSKWALIHFNLYFLFGDHAFANIVKAEHAQHTAMRDALVKTGQQYGLTEELLQAGFTDLVEK